MADDQSQHPEWFDPEVAASFVGKYILIGINNRNSGNEIVSKRQDHGTIIALTSGGMFIERPDGTQFSLPPCYWELKVADPGTYTLHGTGEQVSDPDFVGFISLWPPESQAN